MKRRFALTIFQKLILTFTAIIIIPLTISIYFSQKLAADLIVTQITSETVSSIELVANSVDTMFQQMYSLALYVNDDDNIRGLLSEDYGDLRSEEPANSLAFRKLTRINKFNSIISNLAFNLMSSHSYITIVGLSGTVYTNWSNYGSLPYSYTERGESSSGEIWIRLEPNYVRSESNEYPYVLTFGKNLIYATDRTRHGTLIISVSEQSISELLSADKNQERRAIIDRDGKIISSTQKEWLTRDFKEFCPEKFPTAAKGSFEFINQDGERCILTYSNFRDWKVVDIKSYASITNQMQMVRDRLLFTNVLFMTIFLVVAYAIARGISRPLQNLAAMMLTEMEFPVEILQDAPDMSDKHDEIGILEESFYTMRQNNSLLLTRIIETEQKKRDAELKALQAQISPHFLFNTLNTIRWAAINKNNQKAADMVLALSNLLRMTIVKGDEFITLEDELENLRNYAALLQMRHSVEFELVSDIPGALLQYKLPKLLLQPLVENSIIHGFAGVNEGGKIKISATGTEDGATIIVSDNGVGLDSDKLIEPHKELKFSGIGVANVDERIKLYFGEQYGLKLYSREAGGTNAEISLPPMSMEQGGE